MYDLDPREGLARTRRRDAVEGRFESAALAFHERVRAAFLAIARREPERVAVVAVHGDASRRLRRHVEDPLRAVRARMTIATEEVLERLAGSPEQFPGALLLSGHSEAELERESRRLAARLLCPGDDPDATCGSCRRVDAGLHPDFLSVEPEGVQIRVDRVREALAFSAGRPYESARRVARILRADLLGIEAENALLKSLEEPGERFRWILDHGPARASALDDPLALHAGRASRALAGRPAARLGRARVLPGATPAISSSSPPTTKRTRRAGWSSRASCGRSS